MDDKKDISKQQSLSLFLDGQVRTNPFGLNRAAERTYRRAERICAAAFLITGHVSADENIRNEIRSAATGLLSDALCLRDDMRSIQSKKVLQLQLRIRHLISLFKIFGAAGFISEANAATMTEGLDELGNFTTAAQRSSLSENISLSREDLMDIAIGHKSQSAKEDIKDIRPIRDVKDVRVKSDDKQSSNRSTNSNGTNGTSGARIQSILEILRTGGALGIKDISANLPEYSEKMIQRELLGMVALGQVHKIGLKRWSKYSLPQQ